MATVSAWEQAPPEERQGFLEDPMFLAHQSEVRRLQDREMARLLVACRTSSDPRVTSAIGAYDALARMLALAEGA